MKEETSKNVFDKFSKGKYSYLDFLKVKEYFSNPIDKIELTSLLKNQWNDFTKDAREKDTSLNHIFEKIQYKILLEEKNKAKERYLWHFYRQAAAILIIPITAFFIWFYFSSIPERQNGQFMQSWVEIIAPEGGRIHFQLPDSTTGWLNSGSKLKYPALFSSQREVELSGEAYFEVRHLDQSEFIVDVADMDIKVLGTTFNVSAYNDDSFTNVVLKEGKVEVTGNTGKFQQIMVPGEKLTLDHKTNSVTIGNVDARRYLAWKDGYLILENESLGEVIPRIERWYNAEIEVIDPALLNYRFKATFKDEPLEEVLRLIAITTPLKYRIEKREADVNGVTKQRKVVIEKKK
ncbi:FecR family protein [Bacteroidales bacterium 6E]|nr:FecR family protein [Bacteroidales bacterium 6E]